MRKSFEVILAVIAVVVLFAACGNSRRSEIDARKAALVHKQDSTLAASQRELAIIDSTLEAVKQQYAEMEQTVKAHREALTATEDELRTFNLLRQHRDSLQVQFDVLCAKIKYIHKKQKEVE